MLGRMFSLTGFMKALKQRFTQWYNRRNGRTGTLWEGRYKSVIVQDEDSALRTMASYIDLNPVRAGLTDDPGTYRWSGYAEAVTGDAQALENIAQITGTTAGRLNGGGMDEYAPAESAGMRKRRLLRALIHYRQILGVAGRSRIREDGKTLGREEHARAQTRREFGSGVRREQLMRRVKHLTHGVVFGTREFIDEWFERNRSWFGGGSSEHRETGARPIGKEWRTLYNLRQFRKQC